MSASLETELEENRGEKQGLQDDAGRRVSLYSHCPDAIREASTESNQLGEARVKREPGSWQVPSQTVP